MEAMANMYDAIFNAIDLATGKMARSASWDYVGVGAAIEGSRACCAEWRASCF